MGFASALQFIEKSLSYSNYFTTSLHNITSKYRNSYVCHNLSLSVCRACCCCLLVILDKTLKQEIIKNSLIVLLALSSDHALPAFVILPQISLAFNICSEDFLSPKKRPSMKILLSGLGLGFSVTVPFFLRPREKKPWSILRQNCSLCVFLQTQLLVKGP